MLLELFLLSASVTPDPPLVYNGRVGQLQVRVPRLEADLSVANKFRDELGSEPWKIGKDGCVRPLDKPGIGVEIDEKFLAAHPVIEGPGYV